MEIIATIVGLASGFALMRSHKAPVDMIATSLIVDAALAPLTAIIAARRGRSATRWVIAGFALGMWALAYVLIIAPRQPDAPAHPDNPSRPPTSDAA
jgi:type IV secretory pathway TrbD component